MNTVKRVPTEEEFKRNPELKKEDLEHLKDWYRKQPHYPQHFTDSELILFLHSNYYRLEPTKTTIENFLSCRTHVPEFFYNRDPFLKELRLAAETLLVVPLEQKTAEGYNVIYSRLINFDPERFIYNDGMRLFNMIADLWLLEGGTMKGHVLICDTIGVEMVHALRLSPVGIKKYLFYLQESVPLRIKSMHFINTTPVMDFVLGLMKPFLKKELMDMLFLHSSMDSLKKHISIDILPNEAGGKAGPMMNLYDKVLKNVEEHRDFFLEEQEVLRINETLRPGKAKSATDLFGVEGSFKKLDID